MQEQKSDIQRELEGLEKAREDYARQKTREQWVRGLVSSPSLESIVAGIRGRTEAVLPENAESIKATTDLIADDTSIPNEEIEAWHEKVIDAKIKQTAMDLEDAPQAYGEAVAELEDKANPWNDLQHEQALARYMTEFSLLGGVAMDKGGVISQASEAAESRDIGSLQFWSKHFRTLYEKADVPKTGTRQALTEKADEIERQLSQAVHKHRDSKQAEAAIRLHFLKHEWAAARMPETLKLAGHQINRARSYYLESGRAKPRQRSKKETEMATAKAAIRKRKAELAELQQKAKEGGA